MAEEHFNAALVKFLRDQPGSTIFLDSLLDKIASNDSTEGTSLLAALSRGDGHPSLGPAAYALSLSPDMLRQLVLDRLKRFEEIGLVSLVKPSRLRSPLSMNQDIQVKLSKDFIQLQRALGFSLTEIAGRNAKSFTITPVFARPDVVMCDVFVMMPFSDEMSDAYSVIVDSCVKLNLSVQRADDFFGASHVIQDIWSLINSAKVIVCDCTHKNPNVFYELGIAHTLGKDVILITQNEADVPSDLRHWRYILYGAGEATLPDKLTIAIKGILAK
jgi:hypothetical protein